MLKILVLHGPNLNLLGLREPEIYGKTTLLDINKEMMEFAKKEGMDITIKQSNFEGELIQMLHESVEEYDAIVFNPAAFTHTSIALRDAISAVGIPVIEVHLSNIYKRESFRRHSYISEVSEGVISGFGKDSYFLGLKAAKNLLSKKVKK
ncbi:MAG: type II 3-dehydroquinate dehydratase [Nitrospirae bacterium]|nr:type II 3-dehydroquinate dehydratase [Nitrospirota bacterium]